MKPYFDDGRSVIYHGDVLQVLTDHGFAIDAVVTDPPYASGARSEATKPASGAMMRGARWAAKPMDNDQMTTTGFVWLLRNVALLTAPLLPAGGSWLSFIDWRQWPSLVGALESCDLRVQGMVVWDKGSYALGNGFRSQHELIVHAAKGVPTVFDRSCGNVLRAPRVPPTHHPSPKPAALIARLIEVVTPVGGCVLDPFVGSGSTLVAAAQVGRRSIGIEAVEKYCERAALRLQQMTLFGPSSSVDPLAWEQLQLETDEPEPTAGVS